MDLNKYIRDIQDFPSKGVVFKDITPLLQNPKALQEALKELLKLLSDRKIDKVIGMESRGFLFAPLLAVDLNAGFVPIRKKGKLPYSVLSKSYALEYGEDIMEMHSDAINKGDRVLLHDDVLATGGTAKAVCDLIEEAGGVIVQCNFLIELEFLKGREQLGHFDVKSLIKY